MRKIFERHRTILDRLARHVQRRLQLLQNAAKEALAATPQKVGHIGEQSKQKHAPERLLKLYSWHALEVFCIHKGKVQRSYEFIVKMSIVTTLRSNLIVGAHSFANDPYDSHMLAGAYDRAPSPAGFLHMSIMTFLGKSHPKLYSHYENVLAMGVSNASLATQQE